MKLNEYATVQYAQPQPPPPLEHLTVTCRYRAKDTLRVERHGEHWRFYIESPTGAAGVIMDTDTMRRLFGELLREADRERAVGA